MLEFFFSEKYGPVDYVASGIDLDGESPGQSERDILDREKRRIERALERLRGIYLYDEQTMSESDYAIERKKLMDQLTEVDDRIQELDDNATRERNLSDADFLAKASYYALTQELLSSRHVDYLRLIRNTDPKITKEFVNQVISNFCILDGRITSIRFKNGIEHRFVYKEKSPS